MVTRLKDALNRRREAWPWFDHLVRAGLRYKTDGGDRLAAGLTMYAILSLLPLLLVAMSVLGYVLANDPERQREIFTTLASALPGVGAQLGEALTSVERSRATTGIVGLVGLLFSGLGGVSALRDALRLMWHQDTAAGNFLKKKGTDAITVALVGLTLAVSFAISALAAGGAGALLDAADVGSTAADVVLYLLAFAIGVAVDAALFLVLFKWLPRVDWPWQRLVRGAVFGGFGFGLLKLAGGWYVARTATRSSALYGSIGSAVAVLVGLYLVSRVVLFTAAWTVTAPGWDDVEPSGTASPEAARQAGVPLAAVGTYDADGEPDKGLDGVPRREPAGVAAGKPDRRDGGDRRRSRESRPGLAVPAARGFAAMVVAVLSLRGLRSLRRT